jgi:flagellar biosynthesis/type III secretory pathway chaperone
VNGLLSELVAILDQEIELHKELLSLVHRDRELIIELCPEEIFENNKKKETVVLKIKMLEESRLLLLDRLSPHYGVSSPKLTLSKVASLAEEPYRSRLDACRSTLLALIKSIRDVNQSNSLIVKDSLHYFECSLDFLHYTSAASPTYLDSGRIKDPVHLRGLLSKEI